MRIVIGAPGNGLALKDALKEHLHRDERVSAVTDLSEPDITYPQVSFRAGRIISEERADRGILVCGTGVGTAIAACKVRGVRAATAPTSSPCAAQWRTTTPRSCAWGRTSSLHPPPGRWSTSGSTCATIPPPATARRSARSTPMKQAAEGRCAPVGRGCCGLRCHLVTGQWSRLGFPPTAG